MDPAAPASFIPKKPLVGETSRGGFGLLTLIAVLLFAASVIAAGSAFLYQQYLNSAVAGKDASLKKAEGAFETNTIDDLSRMDARLAQAHMLLSKHVAPSGIFTFLAATTLEHVQFSGFEYSLNGDGSGTLSLGGVADSFSTLALQSDQFGASKVLKDVIFSGITTNATGQVVFNVKATIDPSLLLYAKNQSGAVVNTAPASQATSTQ